ncbi:unnamed protein product [Rodentolepis nana]|uniref:Multidrug and toxin extrusion protein n=1 Tax=Rodentolepis nana TaxID=102285 RepID=A0A0R3T7S4_RODNA|nr:unnamed protein product [Rodentolepis nana]
MLATRGPWSSIDLGLAEPIGGTSYPIGLIFVMNKVYPPLVGSIVGNIVNFGSHYLFYHYTQYGFVGSALSQSIAFLSQLIVIVVYIHISKIYRKTWDAIHVELWHDWGTWFKLAIPGMMMLGLEWWVCESGSILAGIRGEQYLAVQTILNNVESMLFCTFPLGFCVSTSIRIGQFVGANKAEGPISTALIALITIFCLCSMNAVILLFTRSYIPRIFTNDATQYTQQSKGTSSWLTSAPCTVLGSCPLCALWGLAAWRLHYTRYSTNLSTQSLISQQDGGSCGQQFSTGAACFEHIL